MRIAVIAFGFAVGFALVWWASGMTETTENISHSAPPTAHNELPRLLRPGLGFAFLAPAPRD